MVCHRAHIHKCFGEHTQRLCYKVASTLLATVQVAVEARTVSSPFLSGFFTGLHTEARLNGFFGSASVCCATLSCG